MGFYYTENKRRMQRVLIMYVTAKKNPKTYLSVYENKQKTIFFRILHARSG